MRRRLVALLTLLTLCWACNPIGDYPSHVGPAPVESPSADAGTGSGGTGGASEGEMDASAPPEYDADASADNASEGGDAGAAPDAALDAASDGGDAAQPCGSETSDAGIPGVTIQIDGDRCTFAYGQGGTFRYRVTLDRAIPYSVAAGGSCGFCGKFGADAESLVRAMVVALDATHVQYCANCDLGCCPPNRAGSYQLSPQSLSGTLAWPARSWSGPSDTDAKPGALFPRGASAVRVSLDLPDGVRAVGELPITIE